MDSPELFQFQPELHQSQSELHQFHFVISNSMKENLLNLKIFKETLSLSSVIVKVLEWLTPVIKREHNWGDQRMSQYRYVSPDPNEKRKHVYSYLPEDLYRELKLIHQDLNIYSIAQMMRELLGVFLVMVDEYGDTVLEELDKMYEEWEKKAAMTRLTLRQYLQQLWKIVQHIPEGQRLVTVYDGHFSPFWRFRL